MKSVNLISNKMFNKIREEEQTLIPLECSGYQNILEETLLALTSVQSVRLCQGKFGCHPNSVLLTGSHFLFSLTRLLWVSSMRSRPPLFYSALDHQCLAQYMAWAKGGYVFWKEYVYRSRSWCSHNTNNGWFSNPNLLVTGYVILDQSFKFFGPPFSSWVKEGIGMASLFTSVIPEHRSKCDGASLVHSTVNVSFRRLFISPLCTYPRAQQKRAGSTKLWPKLQRILRRLLGVSEFAWPQEILQ